MTLRIQFAHGLESNPQGNKARLFAANFEALTPAMDTSDFASCVALQAESAAAFRPDLLIGSSFGGAVVVTLLARGLWRGPSLLLAQAAGYYAPELQLPPGARVTLVHARQDEIVPFEHSVQLAAGADPTLVELIACDDDHALSGLLRSGQLLALVQRAALARVPNT